MIDQDKFGVFLKIGLAVSIGMVFCLIAKIIKLTLELT